MPRGFPGPDRLWRASRSPSLPGAGWRLRRRRVLCSAGSGAAGGFAMNFSEVFKLSNQLCKFSPDGKYLVSGRRARAEVGSSVGTPDRGAEAAAGPRGKAAWGSAGAGCGQGPRTGGLGAGPGQVPPPAPGFPPAAGGWKQRFLYTQETAAAGGYFATKRQAHSRPSVKGAGAAAVTPFPAPFAGAASWRSVSHRWAGSRSFQGCRVVSCPVHEA